LSGFYRVLLKTSAFKEVADVAGGEQTTGRKETPKQKKALQAQTSGGGKGNTTLGCGLPPESWNI
jgi:hypothetical protein